MEETHDLPGATSRTRSTARFIFESIEGVVLLIVVFVSWPLSKAFLRNWGSSVNERTRLWPGDDLVAPNHRTHTRAIGISASVEVVWRWVVQFGLDRAGFYSYELLERLAGIPVTNVEVIDPEFQRLAVGDEVRLHPKAPGIPIAFLEPHRHICFGVPDESSRLTKQPDPARSWSVYLERRSPQTCRLVLRSCVEPLREPTWRNRVALKLEEPVDFLMEQRMLRTIKRLAELHTN